MSITAKTGLGTVAEAVAAFEPDAIGWACSASEAYWVRRAAGCLFRMGATAGRAGRDDCDATEVDATDRLAEVFELRLFNAAAELRWVHAVNGQGRWKVLDDDTAEQHHLTRLDLHPPPRLLWGQVADVRDGWSRLADPRIGSVWVPHRAVRQDHIVLDVVEYAHADQYGNTAVADERCTGLSLRRHEDLVQPTGYRTKGKR